ncbi:MAG: hypothetical protein ACTSV7_06805 [Candidatus Baldrarchaeia archaeon]
MVDKKVDLDKIKELMKTLKPEVLKLKPNERVIIDGHILVEADEKGKVKEITIFK